jgi:cystathionine gamma-synthase
MPALSTLTVHGDDDVNKIPSSLQREVSDVAPAMHVSTTFRYSKNPEELVEAKDVDVSLPLSLCVKSMLTWE